MQIKSLQTTQAILMSQKYYTYAFKKFYDYLIYKNMQGGNTNERIIFVDESGNPGIKNTDGNYFVVSAIILENQTDCNKLTETIEKYLKTINWKTDF